MPKLVKTATEFELSPTLGMNEEVKRQRCASMLHCSKCSSVRVATREQETTTSKGMHPW